MRKEPIRILTMINTLEVGGTEMRLVELARRLPRDRFEMEIACMVSTGAYEPLVREAGVPIHVIGYLPMREGGRLHSDRVLTLPLMGKRVADLLRRVKPDVFHTFLPNCNVFGAAASALCGFRGLIASRVFTSDYRSINPLYPIIENWAARRAARIVCNCEAVRQETLQREKVDPNKVCVVLNGIDAEKFRPRPKDTELLKSLGLPANAPIVAIVANLLPHKRHEDFLQAAAQVAKDFPQAHFLVIGRPYDREAELRALARKLGIASQTHFLGPRKDLPDLYPQMDVLVSTSTDEGLSNALIEGQSCGIPAVATAIAGTPEIVLDGQTGFLIPPLQSQTAAEKIGILLQNPRQRQSFGIAARHKVLRLFSLDRMIDAYALLYEEVARTGKIDI